MSMAAYQNACPECGQLMSRDKGDKFGDIMPYPQQDKNNAMRSWGYYCKRCGYKKEPKHIPLDLHIFWSLT